MQDKINKWQKLNAELILNEAHKKFFEHVQISNSPAAQLDSDQKEFKKHYRAGRKELEHEFSKSSATRLFVACLKEQLLRSFVTSNQFGS